MTAAVGAFLRAIFQKSNVQAVIALTLTGGFLVGFNAQGIITADQFNVAYALVLGFFFGRMSTGG